MAEESAGTNPEAEFTSAESIVENMLSRPEGDNNAGDTSDEAGNQTTEESVKKPEGEKAAEDKQGDEAETKSAEVKKPAEEAKFELPKQQDKDYSKEVKAHYAKRFGSTFEDAEKNPSLMAAIKQAIDKDIYIEQLKAKDAEKVTAEAAAKAAEKTTDAKPAETTAKPTTQEYLAQLEKDIETVNDPEISAAFKGELWKALAGIDVNDPKVAAELKERGIDPDGPVKVLTKFGLNLARHAANAAVEQERARFNDAVEERYPGFSTMYTHAVRSQVWDGVRGSDESYKALPEYGTTEFTKTVDDILEKNPWVNEIQIPGKSAPEVMQAKYAIVARIASGEKVKPADVAAAAEAGRKQGEQAARDKSRANLDSGRTAGGGKGGDGGSDIVSEYLSRKRGF